MYILHTTVSLHTFALHTVKLPPRNIRTKIHRSSRSGEFTASSRRLAPSILRSAGGGGWTALLFSSHERDFRQNSYMYGVAVKWRKNKGTKEKNVLLKRFLLFFLLRIYNELLMDYHIISRVNTITASQTGEFGPFLQDRKFFTLHHSLAVSLYTVYKIKASSHLCYKHCSGCSIYPMCKWLKPPSNLRSTTLPPKPRGNPIMVSGRHTG